VLGQPAPREHEGARLSILTGEFVVVYDAPGNEELEALCKDSRTPSKCSHYYAVKLLFWRDVSAVAQDRSNYAANVVKRGILLQVTICN